MTDGQHAAFFFNVNKITNFFFGLFFLVNLGSSKIPTQSTF